jgi:hypothetical protein
MPSPVIETICLISKHCLGLGLGLGGHCLGLGLGLGGDCLGLGLVSWSHHC